MSHTKISTAEAAHGGMEPGEWLWRMQWCKSIGVSPADAWMLAARAWRERDSQPVAKPDPCDVEQYRTTHKRDFLPFDRRGYCTMRVLPELTGRKMDACALGWISALSPSCIRVTTGEVKCDSIIGRVTVVVDLQDIIQSTEQEVQVGLPPGVPNGGAMFEYLYSREADAVQNQYTEAIECAISALEYRADSAETRGVPIAVEDRNTGVLEAILEGIKEDREAAVALRALINKKKS